MAPIMNNTSEHMITYFLPKESLQGPAISDPINAPNKASETINSFYTVVISGHVSLKYNYAPAIMPVS